jgi:hypothetical protein
MTAHAAGVKPDRGGPGIRPQPMGGIKARRPFTDITRAFQVTFE